jgi:hypothetical protein
MNAYRNLLAILGVLLMHGLGHAEDSELPLIDFVRYFPQFVAVSEEVKTSKLSIQYKFFSVGDEQDRQFWLWITSHQGRDQILRYAGKGPLEVSEKAFRLAISKFSEVEKVKFEIFDLRDVRSFEAFKRRANDLGWRSEVRCLTPQAKPTPGRAAGAVHC